MTLPIYRNRFVGREQDAARLRQATSSSGGLVTLLGPGGVGKTRLAVRLLRARRGPVAFVDLSGARTDEALVRTVLSSLSLRGDVSSADEAVERVGGWLARRPRLLLVLDNFEQLPASAGDVVRTWRNAAPAVDILVTSRRPLGVPDEVHLPIAPMPVEEAVALFLDRVPAEAARVDPVADASAVAEIVECLDRLPLAIELAAARLDILTLPALRAALAERFEVVRDLGRSGPERHHTLWRTIDWSWQMLPDWQQQALLQLSPFRGGIPLDAARAVIRVDGEANALDALQGLVRASLLRVAEPAGGIPRYAMLECIHAFVAAQANAHPALQAEAEERHAAWFLAHATAWRRRFEHDVAEDRFSREYPNLDAVCARGLARDDAEGAAQAVRALAEIRQLEWRGWQLDKVARCGRVIEAARRHRLPASTSLCEVYSHRAHALRRAGRLDEALTDMEESVRLAHACGDRREEAMMRGYLANLHSLFGREDEARAGYEAALAIGREIGDPLLTGSALTALATWLARHGHLDEAIRRAEESVAEHRRLAPTHYGVFETCARLGDLHFRAGHLAQSEALLLEATRGPTRGNAWILVSAFSNLGRARHAQGDLEGAAAAFDEASAHFQEQAMGGTAAQLWMGLLAIEQDDPARGIPLITAALDLLTEASPQFVLMAHLGLGIAAVLQGDAARIREHAESMRALFDDALPPDRALGAVPGVLDTLAAACEAAAHRDRVAMRRALDAVDVSPLAEGFHGQLRIAERLIAHAMARVAHRGAAWRVGAGGRWFAPPEGNPVSLAHRRVLSAAVNLLAETRLRAPGRVIPSVDLAHALWPDTPPDSSAAKNRLYNAMSTLRGMGLEILEREGPGYRLKPDLPVCIEAETSELRV